MKAEVDGSKSLLEQQNAINFEEQARNSQLSAYKKGQAPINEATLDSVPLGQNIRALLLVASPTPSSIAAQQANGKRLVFNNTVYVNGVETPVAGFR